MRGCRMRSLFVSMPFAKTLGIKTRSEAVRSLVLLGLSTHYQAERKRTAPTRSKRPHGEACLRRP
jgi:hypothetical protein